MKKTSLTACVCGVLAFPAIAEESQKPDYFSEFMELTDRMINDSIQEAEKQVGAVQDQIVRSKFGIPADAEEVVLEEGELKALLLEDHKGDKTLKIFQVYDPEANKVYIVEQAH